MHMVQGTAVGLQSWSRMARLTFLCQLILADDQGSVLPDVVEVSQQLCEIASLLEVETHGGCAKPLLSAANERLPQILQALPESFFSPLLPQGSLSPDQVGVHLTLQYNFQHSLKVSESCLLDEG